MSTLDPFSPARLGPRTLRNRLIKCATFEGATPDVDAGACRTGPHARRRGGHTAHAGLGGRVLSRKGGGARAAGIGGARQAQELR